MLPLKSKTTPIRPLVFVGHVAAEIEDHA